MTIVVIINNLLTREHILAQHNFTKANTEFILLVLCTLFL